MGVQPRGNLSKWNAHLLYIVSMLCAVQARSPYVRCFERFQRHSIDNSQPIAEHFYVTPHECLNRCIESIGNLAGRPRTTTDGLCKAVVYNHFQHSCRLYDHDGRVVPAITHPAIGFDLFRRTATTQECAGPLERYRQGASGFHFLSKAHSKSAYPADRLSPVAKALSSTFIEQRRRLAPPTDWRNVAQEVPGHFPEPVFPQMATARRTNSAARRRRPSLASRSAKKIITFVDGDIRQANDKSAELYDISKVISSTMEKQEKKIGSLSISIKPIASASSTVDVTRSSALNVWRQCDRFGAFGKTAFYVVTGSRMAMPEEHRLRKPQLASLTYNDVESARQCADRCETITGPNEEPIKCVSFNYFAAEKRCEIFDGAAEPDGPGRLITDQARPLNGSTLYAEKFCIPVNRHLFDCENNQFFALHANRAIRRGALTKTTAKIVVGKTVGACLQSCLNTVGCRTVHFDWSRRKCYLYAARINNADASTARVPVVDIVPSANDGSVVLENGCREIRSVSFGI